MREISRDNGENTELLLQIAARTDGKTLTELGGCPPAVANLQAVFPTPPLMFSTAPSWSHVTSWTGSSGELMDATLLYTVVGGECLLRANVGEIPVAAPGVLLK